MYVLIHSGYATKQQAYLAKFYVIYMETRAANVCATKYPYNF